MLNLISLERFKFWCKKSCKSIENNDFVKYFVTISVSPSYLYTISVVRVIADWSVSVEFIYNNCFTLLINVNDLELQHINAVDI